MATHHINLMELEEAALQDLLPSARGNVSHAIGMLLREKADEMRIMEKNLRRVQGKGKKVSK